MEALSRPIEMALTLETVQQMSIDELEAACESNLQAGAVHLVSVAICAIELERRGRPIPSFGGMSRWFPAISAGRLDPAIVLKYASRPTILMRLQSVPLAEQRAIAVDSKVKLATMEGVLEIPLERLSDSQIRQVISDNGIRNPTEQIGYLQSQKSRTIEKQSKEERRATVSIRGGQARIGSYKIGVGELVEALASQAGPDKIVPDVRAIPDDVDKSEYCVERVRMTQEEHNALLKTAKVSGTAPHHLIRMACRAYGLFTPE